MHGRKHFATGEIWALTSYFNPEGYRRRLSNYRVFRQHLNVPLAAIELAYDRPFELRRGDAELLIQIRGRDVLWQKERLLNIALHCLPRSCQVVVWADCDIVFLTDDWPSQVGRALEHHALLQPFRQVHYLAATGTVDVRRVELQRPAMATHAGQTLASYGDPSVTPQPNGAWGLVGAARRELLEQHSWYDAAILGSGDLVMLAAAHGCFDVPARILSMNSKQRQHFLSWATPFHQAVRGNVGIIDSDILHLWHGERKHRRYRERHQCLVTHGFDPYVDIAIADNGCWRWNSDNPALHEAVRSYFSDRREDGVLQRAAS